MKCYNAEKFRTELYDLVNNCGLSLATAFYIVKDFYKDFSETYFKIVQQEQILPSEEKEGVVIEYQTNFEEEIKKEE